MHDELTIRSFFLIFIFPDDLSPPPRFHLSFLVDNEAGVTLRVITSDNDPPDGFRLEPEQRSIITKEVSNPSDLSIHAVVPGEEKALLLNGQPRIVVAPSKATGDPIVLRVTGKDGESFVCLPGLRIILTYSLAVNPLRS